MGRPRAAFADWLDAVAEVPNVWLPSVDTKLDISLDFSNTWSFWVSDGLSFG
jgi:hypothetical protein